MYNGQQRILINRHFGVERAPAARLGQRGVSLIEFMVGMVIGLMTVAAAMGALMIVHQVSGAVSHVTQMQQDASYAFRVIGRQLRQAGAARLSLAMGKNDAIDAVGPMDKVALLTDGYSSANPPVTGVENPGVSEYTLSVRYANYAKKKFKPDAGGGTPETKNEAQVFLRDCLGDGGNIDAATGAVARPMLVSQFRLKEGELRCRGSAGTEQAIISSVSDFKVKYYLQEAAASASPTVKIVTANGVGGKWDKVSAIEVCLDLMSDGTVHTPAGAQYTRCDGSKAALDNRMHLVLRNTFQIRSQGLMAF
jgi:type IV pilus assembly protein PilW